MDMQKENIKCTRSGFPYMANKDGSCTGLIVRGNITSECPKTECYAVEILRKEGEFLPSLDISEE